MSLTELNIPFAITLLFRKQELILWFLRTIRDKQRVYDMMHAWVKLVFKPLILSYYQKKKLTFKKVKLM